MAFGSGSILQTSELPRLWRISLGQTTVSDCLRATPTFDRVYRNHGIETIKLNKGGVKIYTRSPDEIWWVQEGQWRDPSGARYRF